MADVQIPTHLSQLVDRLTGSEGEQLAQVGVPLDTIVAFGRLWQEECLPILIAEVERLAAASRAQVQFAGTSPSEMRACFACDGTGFEVFGDDGERFECRACDGVGGRVVDRG